MPRHASSAGFDTLGVLITAAYGCDTDWHAEARCNADRYQFTPGIPSPWQFDPTQRVDVDRGDGKMMTLKGEDMIELALMSCFACPAQYDCARYALCAKARAGTYSMKITDLIWLRGDKVPAEAIIDYAEAESIPMQRAVPLARVATEALLAS